MAFTSQLPTLPSAGGIPTPLPTQEVTIKAEKQAKQGDVYQLDGDAEIAFQGYVMRAEHVTYNDANGDAEATGRVVFDGGPHDAHITAGHAKYNVKEETGTFYDVSGTFGAVVRGQTVVLTSSNPFVILTPTRSESFICQRWKSTGWSEKSPLRRSDGEWIRARVVFNAVNQDL